MDDITEDTPCSLHILIGRKGKIVEIAQGIVMPGDTFHNMLIPTDYAKVQVIKVVDDKFLDEELDHPMPDEGIEKLGDAVNNFTLWHRARYHFTQVVSATVGRA